MADRWFTRWFVPMDRIWGPASDVERIRSEDPYLIWSEQKDLHGLRLMVAWAERDNEEIVRTNRAFHQHLVERHIEHESIVFEGRHDWKSWTPIVHDVLRFAVWGSMDAQAPAQSG